MIFWKNKKKKWILIEEREVRAKFENKKDAINFVKKFYVNSSVENWHLFEAIEKC